MFRRSRAVPIALIAVAALSAFLLGAFVASASAAEPKASLAKVNFGTRALKVGMSGTDVRVMQKWLTLLGIDTDVDGSFGPATKKSVVAWEKKAGLPANGVMSVADAKKLRTEIDNSPEAQRNADDPKPDDDEGEDDETTPTTGKTPSPGGESGFTFPVIGKFSWGTGQNEFGADRGGRSHQGHDVMADCGLLIKAVEPGKVVYAGYQASGAGNYIVIRGQQTKRDYVYMHLRSPAKFDTGETVPAKATIGVVGSTGSSSACHLHFELWTPPGWYDGGKAIDPLPYLKQWYAASKRR